MIVIGEKINSSLKSIRPAMEARDKHATKELARLQRDAGASYIDVNAGMFYENEEETLQWLIESIQEVVDLPFAIDSPNVDAIRAGLLANKNGKPIVNSITGESKRFETVLPIIKEFDTAVIALCMDDTGMPESAEDRVRIARKLIHDLTQAGIAMDDIFIDPLVRPIGTGSHYGKVALETIRIVKSEFPEVHIACGLSNVSFGIPARKLINQTFLIAAMSVGMDGAILDPLDKKLMSFLHAGEALLGLDDYCMNFISKFRDGEIEI